LSKAREEAGFFYVCLVSGAAIWLSKDSIFVSMKLRLMGMIFLPLWSRGFFIWVLHDN